MDSRRFVLMPIVGQHRFLYDSHYGVSRITAVGVCINLWTHWCGSSASLRVGLGMVSFDVPFVFCAGELPYGLRLPAIMIRHADPCDEALTAHSWNHVALLCPFDVHSHLLANFDYWLKEAVPECRLRLISTDLLFVNWHRVDLFDITAAR